ncbi:MAG: hypothetical protein FWG18_03170 [Alphaproteobacteria bacterium]|nr:hypothetical protein [Alphaproteobacteria bacterium]
MQKSALLESQIKQLAAMSVPYCIDAISRWYAIKYNAAPVIAKEATYTCVGANPGDEVPGQQRLYFKAVHVFDCPRISITDSNQTIVRVCARLDGLMTEFLIPAVPTEQNINTLFTNKILFEKIKSGIAREFST